MVTAKFNIYPENVLKKWERLIWNFIDGKGDKRCKLNRKDTIKQKKEKGLGLLDLRSEIAALLAH